MPHSYRDFIPFPAFLGHFLVYLVLEIVKMKKIRSILFIGNPFSVREFYRLFNLFSSLAGYT
ncbi:MAG: hypothetical protein FMNOHCHN_01259 [Ignavibacteriaceae bacterium]|nr:hypothetical protein [Ignavibacteriaceae bacterium]